MSTTATLSLGTRKDAIYWSKECSSQLGFTAGSTIATPSPELSDIKNYFSRSDEWLFFGGHFTEVDHLYNDDESIKIKFHSDKVVISHGSKTETLLKGTTFLQHQKVKVIFWGGCNVHSDDKTREAIRALFGSPMMIGWRSITGWQVMYSVMGGYGNVAPNAARDFFDRAAADPKNETIVRKAWLETANDTQWGSNTPTFSVYDSDGDEHSL
jgi:hypothetical protein